MKKSGINKHLFQNENMFVIVKVDVLSKIIEWGVKAKLIVIDQGLLGLWQMGDSPGFSSM